MKAVTPGLVIVFALVACGDPEIPTPPPVDAEACAPPVMWKRTTALVDDVYAALSLDPSTCVEAGAATCVQAHKVALGEAEPFMKTLYQRPKTPLATTPLAFERVVVRACAERVELDRAGEPVVFAALDFSAAAVEPTGSGTEAVVAELYRRFHGREPTAREVLAIQWLAVDEAGRRAPADFALLACIAVGSSVESLFY